MEKLDINQHRTQKSILDRFDDARNKHTKAVFMLSIPFLHGVSWIVLEKSPKKPFAFHLLSIQNTF
jgi:hypothetical protein